MTILIQQDYAQAGDSLGTRAKVRPQDIKSGTYYGQLQLRGSILAIKDSSTTASGYMAFGSDMSTIPTSSSTGTGIYIDYAGIYGNASGTPQFYLQSSDGKAYAGAGAVVLDSDGITIAAGTSTTNFIKWTLNSGYINVDGDGQDSTGTFKITAPETDGTSFMNLQADANGSNGIRFTLRTYGPAHASAGNNYANLIGSSVVGFLIGTSASSVTPSSLLHLYSTAPTFRMQDTTASAKSLLVTVDANLATFEEAAGTDILVMDLANAAVYLSDTSNADMTIGLTINQGANDNQIFALKSSDVAHGVTTLAETDTFGYITKVEAAGGGINLVGLRDNGTVGIRVAGVSSAANTTKTTGGLGSVTIDAFLASGTGVASIGADGNILAVRDNGTSRFILDADGDSHQDVGTAWTNFDEHDDLALLNLVSAHVTRHDDPLRENFGAWLEQSRDDLERLKLVTFNGDGHHFVNWSRMHMLQVGALRQIGERLERLERERLH